MLHSALPSLLRRRWSQIASSFWALPTSQAAPLPVKYRSCPGQGKPYTHFHGPGGRARRTTVVGVATPAEEPRLRLPSYSLADHCSHYAHLQAAPTWSVWSRSGALQVRPGMEYDRTAVGPRQPARLPGAEASEPLQPWKLVHSPTGLSFRNNAGIGGIRAGRASPERNGRVEATRSSTPATPAIDGLPDAVDDLFEGEVPL